MLDPALARRLSRPEAWSLPRGPDSSVELQPLGPAQEDKTTVVHSHFQIGHDDEEEEPGVPDVPGLVPADPECAEEDGDCKSPRSKSTTLSISLSYSYGGDQGRHQSLPHEHHHGGHQRNRWWRHRQRNLHHALSAGTYLPTSRLLILPGSRWKRMWDLLVAVLLLYTVVVLPLQLAFGVMAEWQSVMDYLMDAVFAVDICLSFCTIQELPSGEVLLSHKQIAKNYTKSWFIPDLVATFPLYLVLEGSTFSLTRLLRVLRFMRALRLLKLMQNSRFQQLIEDIEYSPKIHPGTVRILKFIAVAVVVIHMASCLWIFAGDAENPDSWLNRAFPDDPIADKDSGSVYLASLYFTLTTLLTIGFGDITPRTSVELGITILLMVTGTTFFAYTTATVTSIIATGDTVSTYFRTRMHHLVSFIKTVRLSPELSKKLVKTMRYVWMQPQSLDWRALLKDVPQEMRYDVSLDMHRDLIAETSWFQRLAPYKGFVAAVAQELKPAEYSEGEIIVRRGQPVQNWFIVVSGLVDVISSSTGALYFRLEKGATFGDVGVLLTNQWEATMRAGSRVRVFLVPKKTMLTLVDEFDRTAECDDQFYGILKAIAKERVKELKKAKADARHEMEVAMRLMHRRDRSRGGPALLGDAQPSMLRQPSESVPGHKLLGSVLGSIKAGFSAPPEPSTGAGKHGLEKRLDLKPMHEAPRGHRRTRSAGVAELRRTEARFGNLKESHKNNSLLLSVSRDNSASMEVPLFQRTASSDRKSLRSSTEGPPTGAFTRAPSMAVGEKPPLPRPSTRISTEGPPALGRAGTVLGMYNAKKMPFTRVGSEPVTSPKGALLDQPLRISNMKALSPAVSSRSASSQPKVPESPPTSKGPDRTLLLRPPTQMSGHRRSVSDGATDRKPLRRSQSEKRFSNKTTKELGQDPDNQLSVVASPAPALSRRISPSPAPPLPRRVIAGATGSPLLRQRSGTRVDPERAALVSEITNDVATLMVLLMSGKKLPAAAS